MPRGSSVLVLALFVASRAAGREASAGGAILVSPEAPVVGGPLRVVAVSDRPLDGTLSFVAPDGGELAATRERRGGPPYWWYLEAATRAAGAHRACLVGSGDDVYGGRGRQVRAATRWRRGLARHTGVEPCHRGALLGVDREALRRSARRGAQLARARRGDAPGGAELPPRLPGARGGWRARPPARARLCRPAVLPARLFRVEGRTAVRLVGV